MRIREVVVLDDVSEDIDNGILFYRANGDWLGDYFSNSIISEIESLRIYAGIHSKYYGFYRMFAKRFPYAIYYDLFKEIAIVVAVLNMRRDPKWIREKLGSRNVD
ncbi:MAG: type II toxin-antitoxin system RelE/ParE family toxin [Bacteroidetes bacterium]|nr:MAG: type II toxin-antitoxin system RelE/ParE family toxin [Bacteroidota bacterium]